MKKIVLSIICFVLLFSCMNKEPIEYYNKAVYAGNMSLSLGQMESRIERIQEGFDVEPSDLTNRTSMRVQVNEAYLSSLNDFLGNDVADPMIKAAMDYIKCDIDITKNKKTIALLNEIDKISNIDELQLTLETYGDHLDSIYNVRNEIYQTYDFEVSKYAKTHDIEEKFYGPNLQPLEKDIK